MQKDVRLTVRNIWQNYQWVGLILAWAAAFLFGLAGFARYAALHGLAWSFLDDFYLTLQLIPMNSGALEPPLPWQLEFARVFVPALTAAAAFKAFLSLFKQQAQMWGLATIQNHIVICGLSRKGYLLVKSFRESGEKVVVIEEDEQNDWLAPSRELGAVVLIGDATEQAMLLRAGVLRARCLISVCDDDGTNAEVAVLAREICRQRQGPALNCLIHIYDPQLFHLLRERENALEQGSRFWLELFNVFDRGARDLWQRFPAFDPTYPESCGSPHILVMGLGKFGQSTLLQAARSWWGCYKQTGQKLRITVLDREVDGPIDFIRLRYPQLEKACEFIPVRAEIRTPRFEEARFLFDEQGNCDLRAVYICVDNDSLSLHAGLSLSQHLRASQIPIIIRMAEENGLASLLNKGMNGNGHYGNIFAYGLLDRTCTPALVLNTIHEVLARASHEEYIRQQKEVGQTIASNPVIVPWEQLPEVYRQTNYSRVDRINTELEAIGYHIIPLIDWEAALFTFSTDEIERMAQVEHDLWCAELTAKGWVLGTVKDPKRKTHPALVSWPVLPEDEKAKDRAMVRNIPGLLDQAGYQVEKI